MRNDTKEERASQEVKTYGEDSVTSWGPSSYICIMTTPIISLTDLVSLSDDTHEDIPLATQAVERMYDALHLPKPTISVVDSPLGLSEERKATRWDYARVKRLIRSRSIGRATRRWRQWVAINRPGPDGFRLRTLPPDAPDAPESRIFNVYRHTQSAIMGALNAAKMDWVGFSVIPDTPQVLDHLSVEYPSSDGLITAVLDVLTYSGGYLPLPNRCVISRKPIVVHKQNGVMHKDLAPAFAYADGFRGYVLHGVGVPKYVAMTAPEKFDCKRMYKAYVNNEVRREIIRKVGIEVVCSRLGAQVVDRQGDYELINLKLGELWGDEYKPYLKMKNPSIGVYHLEGVHPRCRTVAQALRFRNGTARKPTQLT